MITDKQKKEFVEQMLHQFAIDLKFREALEWLISEMDKTYDALVQDKIDEAFDKYWENVGKC